MTLNFIVDLYEVGFSITYKFPSTQSIHFHILYFLRKQMGSSNSKLLEVLIVLVILLHSNVEQIICSLTLFFRLLLCVFISLLYLQQQGEKGNRKRYLPSDKDRPGSPLSKRMAMSPDRGEEIHLFTQTSFTVSHSYTTYGDNTGSCQL